MKINEMKMLIKENFHKQKNPLFFHGSPGIGKTDGIEQALQELRVELKKPKLLLRTIILSQYESVDLRGLPSIIRDKKEVGATQWNPPNDLTFADDAEGIVFFDEMSNAASDVQKAAQQIIHARMLGELKIPDGIVFIAAGNRQADKAGANRLLTALANRFEHHDVLVDTEDWIKWAISKGIDHSVIGFLAWRPDKLNQFDSNQYINATPRSWEKVSHLVGSQQFAARVEGVIGKGIGAEFLGYCDVWRELPDCYAIWKNPEKVKMPDRQDVVYATAISLALKCNMENFSASLKFMKQAGKEMQVLFLRYSCSTCQDVRSHKDFMQFLKDNAGVMFHN